MNTAELTFCAWSDTCSYLNPDKYEKNEANFKYAYPEHGLIMAECVHIQNGSYAETYETSDNRKVMKYYIFYCVEFVCCCLFVFIM